MQQIQLDVVVHIEICSHLKEKKKEKKRKKINNLYG
jgi:hypothetical protein